MLGIKTRSTEDIQALVRRIDELPDITALVSRRVEETWPNDWDDGRGEEGRKARYEEYMGEVIKKELKASRTTYQITDPAGISHPCGTCHKSVNFGRVTVVNPTKMRGTLTLSYAAIHTLQEHNSTNYSTEGHGVFYGPYTKEGKVLSRDLRKLERILR